MADDINSLLVMQTGVQDLCWEESDSVSEWGPLAAKLGLH